MKRIVIMASLLSLFNFGCSSIKNEIIENHRLSGIIDAVYTVTEYAPEDKDERILNYLDKKIDAGEITEDDKQVILKCLERTEKSIHWRNNK